MRVSPIKHPSTRLTDLPDPQDMAARVDRFKLFRACSSRGNLLQEAEQSRIAEMLRQAPDSIRPLGMTWRRQMLEESLV